MPFRHALAALALLFPALAHADSFTITGQGETITFALPASPTSSLAIDGLGFVVDDVSVVTNGKTSLDSIAFGTSTLLGAFVMSTDTPLNLSAASLCQIWPFLALGPQLFSGSASDPTFNLGTYTLSTLDGPYTMTIASGASSTAVAATPEPPSLVLLGLGTVGLAGAVRWKFAG